MVRLTILKYYIPYTMKPKYKENPDLPLKVCITVTGDKEYVKHCFRKNKAWFPRGVELIELNGKFYMPDSKLISFDHELKTYFVKQEGKYGGKICFNGVIGYNVEAQEFILGDFTMNKYNNVTVMTPDREFYAINADVLVGSGYTEELATGQYKRNLKENKILNKINHANKGYNIEENGYERLIDTYNKKPYKFDINHAKIGNLLKGTTFGIELEACAGNLPNHLLARTGCCICKDGSLIGGDGLYPPEYVTVPLSGGKGIGNAIELCGYLSERNIADLKCSFHAHLGGFVTSRQFLVSLHSLCYKIQSDVFKMFPAYKLNPEGIKGKNYCKVLPKVFKQYDSADDYNDYINNAYKMLYAYLSSYSHGDTIKKVQPNQFNNRKNKVHNGGKAKWNRLARYHWINMINSVFSSRNTVEFRIHTPTFNATKVVNWLLICNAICKYAERYPLRCIDSTKISFTDVLNYYRDTNSGNVYATYVSNYLNAYVNERITLFKADKKAGDMLSNHELENDKAYTFTFENKTLF